MSEMKIDPTASKSPEKLPETIFRLQAHHAAWTTRSTIGEFVLALKHVEQGLGIYDLEQHASSAFVYAGHDAGVCGRSSGALISWVLGYPDRALHLAEEGEVTARRLSHPFSSAQALCYKAILHQLRSETESVDRYADELLAHCAEHDLKIWSYNGQMLKGWSLLRQAQVDEGRRRFRDALDERGATRVTHRQAYYLAILADALGLAGQPEEALDAIGQALELINSAEDRRWEALAHRVRGDLLFTPPCRDEAAAEEALQRAVEVARGQEAKSLELRAATSLARLLVARDERQKAHDLLASIYSWFTEGFDTADLKEAEALLAELA